MKLNLAIRGHDFNRVDTPEELAQKITATGIKSIQFALPMSFPQIPSDGVNMNPGMGSHFRRVFKQHDMEIAVLSCYINMIHPDESERAHVLDKFERYLKVAKSFGAQMVATETGCVDAEIHYTEDNFTQEAFEKVVASVKQLANVAEKVGMTVAIEGGMNHPIYSPQKVRELLDRVQSPNVQIILDVTNFLRGHNYQEQRAIIDESFELFGSELIGIHLKDFEVVDGEVRPVAIGTGQMDFAYLLEKVHAQKPYLHLIMEETKEKDVPAAIRYLEKLSESI